MNWQARTDLRRACPGTTAPPQRTHQVESVLTYQTGFPSHQVEGLGFPCVFKPVDGAGSIGVTVATDPADAAAAWQAARAPRGMYCCGAVYPQPAETTRACTAANTSAPSTTASSTTSCTTRTPRSPPNSRPQLDTLASCGVYAVRAVPQCRSAAMTRQPIGPAPVTRTRLPRTSPARRAA